jgi:membrane fusion protein, multidrug efflux system
VPVVAVQRGPQGNFLYVVKQDKTVEVRPVTVGPTNGSYASIDHGLTYGETVVVDGMDKLRQGSNVLLADQDGHSSSSRRTAK